jgi:hypothetical protein
MNYMYQFDSAAWTWRMPGVPNGRIRRSDRPLNYSITPLPSLVKNALNENVGLGGPASRRALWGYNGDMYMSPADGLIDWNKNNAIDPVMLPIYLDINWQTDQGDGCPVDDPADATPLKGYDDWNHLQYNFRLSDAFAKGGNLPPAAANELNAQANSPEIPSDIYLNPWGAAITIKTAS